MPNAWFRFYSEVVTDRKFQRVAVMLNLDRATVIGIWAGLLCLANDSPERGKLLMAPGVPLTRTEIAESTGIPLATLDQTLATFAELGMVSWEQETLAVIHWDVRQFESDDSAERVKRYRDRRAQSGLPRGMKVDTRAILVRDANQCVYCGSTKNLCVDHMIPIQKGGTDNSDNLAAACKACNSGKAGRRPEEAGYELLTTEARDRYQRALSAVSGDTGVTVTPSRGCNLPEAEAETDSEAEAETDSEQQQQPIAEDVARLFTLIANAGILVSPATAEMYEALIEDYPDISLIQEAFTEAAKSNISPNPKWLRTVLERCSRDHCRPGQWKDSARRKSRDVPVLYEHKVADVPPGFTLEVS